MFCLREIFFNFFCFSFVLLRFRCEDKNWKQIQMLQNSLSTFFFASRNSSRNFNFSPIRSEIENGREATKLNHFGLVDETEATLGVNLCIWLNWNPWIFFFLLLNNVCNEKSAHLKCSVCTLNSCGGLKWRVFVLAIQFFLSLLFCLSTTNRFARVSASPDLYSDTNKYIFKLMEALSFRINFFPSF